MKKFGILVVGRKDGVTPDPMGYVGKWVRKDYASPLDLLDTYERHYDGTGTYVLEIRQHEEDEITDVVTRLYDPDLVNDVTMMGREHVREMMEHPTLADVMEYNDTEGSVYLGGGVGWRR